MKYYMRVRHLATGREQTIHCASADLRGLEIIMLSPYADVLAQWETPDPQLRREDPPNSGRE